MEETIRLGYSGAGKHFLKSAAGFCALLGMALLLNPVSDGTEEKKPNWQDITELEIAGNKVRAGSREGQTQPYKTQKSWFSERCFCRNMIRKNWF